MLIPTEIRCPYKTIPNSDKDKDGVSGKVGDAVAVTCDGAKHSFALVCYAVGKHKAAWASHESCPGIFCSDNIDGSVDPHTFNTVC